MNPANMNDSCRVFNKITIDEYVDEYKKPFRESRSERLERVSGLTKQELYQRRKGVFATISR